MFSYPYFTICPIGLVTLIIYSPVCQTTRHGRRASGFGRRLPILYLSSIRNVHDINLQVENLHCPIYQLEPKYYSSIGDI